MGCTISKINDEEGVARCRARKRFLKHAVASRQAFALAHAQYLQALKRSGAAFRQLGEGDHQEPSSSQTPCPALLALSDARPPPPVSPMEPSSRPRQLAHSRSFQENGADAFLLKVGEMVSISSPSKERPASPEDCQEPRKGGLSHRNRLPLRPPPPICAPRNSWHNLFLDPFRPVLQEEFRSLSPPHHYTERKNRLNIEGDEGMPDLEDAEQETMHQGDKKIQQLASVTAETATMERNMAMGTMKISPDDLTIVASSQGKDLLDVLRELDDLFLKAAESGDSVSWMLETKWVHYYSSFSEDKGITDSGNLFNSSFWSRSLSRSASSLAPPLHKDFAVHTVGENAGTRDSHAATLDRLFAWEKKLSEEMKSAEVIRIYLEKKCTLLCIQDVKGEYPLAIDKQRASIKALHYRFMVALQAVDAASKAVDKLRDEELYLRLLELIEGLRNMWKEMLETHEAQHKIVQEMTLTNYSSAAEGTSSVERQSTLQLATVLSRWIQSFSRVISSQREYVYYLNRWLQLSLQQSDLDSSNEQNKPERSPTITVSTTPIYLLCQEWHKALERLPDKVTLDSINGFVDVVKEWVQLQSEEFKHKKRAERLERELDRKQHILETLERKYFQSAPVNHGFENWNVSPRKASLNESRSRVDQFRIKVEQEKHEMEKSIHATRAMMINSIKHLLPGVFNSMTLFASVAYQIYKGLSAPCVGGFLVSLDKQETLSM